MATTTRQSTVSGVFWGLAGFGLIWSALGVFQFWTSTTSTPDMLMASGLTRAQAESYAQLPLWMNVAFATGVFGGIAGSVLLLTRRRAALLPLMASLVGYLILYAGDVALGIFALFGASQVAILSFVVAVAALLLWLARSGDRRGLLI
jgi:hypothetical protein